MDSRHGTGYGLLLLGLGALGGIIYFGLAGVPRGPAQTAERFVTLLAEGNAETAYELGAPALRTSKTKGMLIVEARGWGLNSYASSSWSEVVREDDEATLAGTVTTEKGEDIPLVIELVRVEDQWRVLSVSLARDQDETGGGEDSRVPAKDD